MDYAKYRARKHTPDTYQDEDWEEYSRKKAELYEKALNSEKYEAEIRVIIDDLEV